MQEREKPEMTLKLKANVVLSAEQSLFLPTPPVFYNLSTNFLLIEYPGFFLFQRLHKTKQVFKKSLLKLSSN